MKQVTQRPRTGAISVIEVPSPQLRPGGMLVRVLASLISAGTERAKLELAEKSLVGKARARPELARQVLDKVRTDGIAETYRTVASRLDAPAPLGYSAAGRVLAVAPDCPGFRVGDLVACGGGLYANHAEIDFVPRQLAARLPDGLTPERGAYAVVGAVALHAVRQGEVGLGDRVVVIGLGLVGLLATQLARAAGARVVGVDLDEAARARALEAGAAHAVAPDRSVASIVDAFTDGAGADVVLVCASSHSNAPLELAGRLARDRGTVVVVGDVGTAFPRELYYHKELQLRLSRSYGPGRYDPSYEEHGHDYPIGYVRWTEQRNIAEFLRLVADGAVDVDALTTHRFDVDRSADAYALLTAPPQSASARPVGVILTYPDDAAPAGNGHVAITTARTNGKSVSREPRRTLGLGVIGAGSFATRILLPALARDPRVELVGVASAGGLSAATAARTFAFSYASSDPGELLADPAVDALVIATRHDTHASLAAAALAAGKAVFCEKPLALSWPELEQVAAAWASSSAPLLVGFNRRYSELSRRLADWLPVGVARAIVYRVNAGASAPEHWTRDPLVGGGRALGELCHFLDLSCFFAEAPPLHVSGELLGGSGTDDSALVHVGFGCGSAAAVQYLANGDPSVPKERLEVVCDGIATIDDFRSLELARSGKRERVKARGRAKGHDEEIGAFVAAALDPAVARDSLGLDAFWSSALTLQAQVALAAHQARAVSLPEALGGAGANA